MVLVQEFSSQDQGVKELLVWLCKRPPEDQTRTGDQVSEVNRLSR